MKRSHIGLVLSGGMDSTLPLHHALYRYRPVEVLDALAQESLFSE